jgi:hypothetical protein
VSRRELALPGLGDREDSPLKVFGLHVSPFGEGEESLEPPAEFRFAPMPLHDIE